MNDVDQPIWYAAYGSNVSSARFRTYLEGGAVPHTTTGRVQEGARDPSPPSGNGPCQIDRTMLFAGASEQWGGGGVAFLDADDSEPEFPVLGRAWRITLGQFEDVFRQENRQDELVSIDLGSLMADGRLDLLDTGYGRIELLDKIDDAPVVTLSRSRPPAELNAAHLSYLKAIVDGLIETWSIDPDDAVRYLAAMPGNAGVLDPAQLAIDIAT